MTESVYNEDLPKPYSRHNQVVTIDQLMELESNEATGGRGAREPLVKVSLYTFSVN